MALTHRHITGDWRDLIPDTPTDPDPYPDEVAPAGNVHLAPVDPGPYIVDGTAYTIADVTALISAGQLHDLQGRAGVWITAAVGDTPIEWTATITLHRPHDVSAYEHRFTATTDMRITTEGVASW